MFYLNRNPVKSTKNVLAVNSRNILGINTCIKVFLEFVEKLVFSRI